MKIVKIDLNTQLNLIILKQINLFYFGNVSTNFHPIYSSLMWFLFILDFSYGFDFRNNKIENQIVKIKSK